MIAVIRYSAGNTRSVINTLQRIGVESIVTDDPETIRAADKVIFPGVGHAREAMESLREKGLDEVIRELRQPFLGICLGLQLLCSHSEEGETEGLGIFKAKVRRFTTDQPVPHMGWNDFQSIDGPLFEGIAPTDDVYFVHSYYADIVPETVAVSEYGVPFSSAMSHQNFYAVQFHAEKSGKVGERLLRNFLESEKINNNA